jgi:succinyl-diaminopimelate desuccinylase
MVNIDSTFPNEARLCTFLSDYLSSVGMKVETQKVEDSRFNIFAQKGAGEAHVLFLGHIDTVPAAAGWSSDPCKIRREGDKLHGLGCFDMKGGISSAIKSVEEAEGSVKLLLCIDEENISKGAWKAVKDKREWFKGISLVVSPEPILDNGTYAKSENIVTLGSGGRVVIEVDVHGKSAHQARSEEGINAIEEMAKIISNIGKMELRKHDKLGKEEIFVRMVEGASKGLSVPEDARFEMDMRLVPPSSASDAVQRLHSLVEGLKDKGVLNERAEVDVKVKARETPYLEPYLTDTKNREVAKVLEVLGSHYGSYAVSYDRSVSDENVIANSLKVPVMRIGPKGSGAHSKDEWVSYGSVRDLAKLYTEIIKRID